MIVISESGDHEQEAGRVSSSSMDTTMLGPAIKVKLCKESHPAVEYVYAWKTFHLGISSCVRTGDALTPQTSCLELNVWTPVVWLVAYIHIGCVDLEQI